MVSSNTKLLIIVVLLALSSPVQAHGFDISSIVSKLKNKAEKKLGLKTKEESTNNFIKQE